MKKNRLIELAAGFSAALYALYRVYWVLYSIYNNWYTTALQQATPGMNKFLTLFEGGETIVFILCVFAMFYAFLAVSSAKRLDNCVFIVLTCVMAEIALLNIRNVPVANSMLVLFDYISLAIEILALAAVIILLLIDTVPEMKGMKTLKKVAGLVALVAVAAVLLVALAQLVIDVLTPQWARYWFDYVGDFLLFILSGALLARSFVALPAATVPAAASADAPAPGLDKSCRFPFGLHIALLFITCGVWPLIWVYKTTNFTNAAEGACERDPKVHTLIYFFVPLFPVYWTYKTAQRLDKIAAECGVQSNLTKICLILAFFVPVVPPILMQKVVNDCIEKGLQKKEVTAE